MTLLMATLMQMGFGFFGIQAVSVAAGEHKEEVTKINTTVRSLTAIEKEEKRTADNLQRAVQWAIIPQFAKICLLVSAFIGEVVCIFLLAGPAAGRPMFVPFELGADFQAPLSEGGLEG